MATLRADSACSAESHTSIGWVAGGGVEVGFTPRWSAKAEWLYLDLADSNFSVTGTNNGLAANLCASASIIVSSARSDYPHKRSSPATIGQVARRSCKFRCVIANKV